MISRVLSRISVEMPVVFHRYRRILPFFLLFPEPFYFERLIVVYTDGTDMADALFLDFACLIVD